MKLSRNWAFLALFSLMGALGIVSGQRFFVCPGDQVARTICCCPGHADGSPPAPDARLTISSACCCNITQVDRPSAPSEPARKAAVDLRPVQLLAAFILPSSAQLGGTDGLLSSGPLVESNTTRPPPIPVLLRKQSFLI